MSNKAYRRTNPNSVRFDQPEIQVTDPIDKIYKELVGNIVLKSVRSCCVVDSAATNVIGCKMDCNFTHIFQYS